MTEIGVTSSIFGLICLFRPDANVFTSSIFCPLCTLRAIILNERPFRPAWRGKATPHRKGEDTHPGYPWPEFLLYV